MLRYLMLSLVLTQVENLYAREFFTTEVTYTLYTQNIRDQIPAALGQALRGNYYFSDDGQVVWENGFPQRGVRLTKDGGKVQASFQVTSLASVIDSILLTNVTEQNELHRKRALSFLALSLSSVVPMQIEFDQRVKERSATYQFHSPYRDEEEYSYHLTITFTRPVRSPH